jgi:hypothetical protein
MVWDTQIPQPGWGLCREHFFLGAEDLSILLTTTQQVAIRGLSAGCIWRVDQVSPTGCTSIRIAATLGYE